MSPLVKLDFKMQAHRKSAVLATFLLSNTVLAGPPPTHELEALAYPLFNNASNRPFTQPVEKEKESKLDFDWDSGLYFRTGNKNFKFNIGAKLHADIARISSDLDDKAPAKFAFNDDSEFRRARIYLEGSWYKNIEFEVQVELADGVKNAELKGASINLSHIDALIFQFGQFREPFSLDQLTSSSNGAFMERSIPTELAPNRSTGVMAHGAFGNKRFSYAIGAFLADDDEGSIRQSGDRAYTARLTHLLAADDDSYLHLGVAASKRDVSGGRFDISFPPPAHLSPNVLKENDIFAADETELTGLEIAAVHHSTWAIFEMLRTEVKATDGLADASLSGYYASAGWFITGENRSYKKSRGAFGKAKPASSFSTNNGGWGAWEIAVRYSEIEFENLRDKNVVTLFTDELTSTTIGLNWYLNSNMRVMLNYVEFELTSPAGAPTPSDGSGEIIQARLSLTL